MAELAKRGIQARGPVNLLKTILTAAVKSGKRKRPQPLSLRLESLFHLLGRGGQIRTADLTDPNRARYQTALRPEWALLGLTAG